MPLLTFIHMQQFTKFISFLESVTKKIDSPRHFVNVASPAMQYFISQEISYKF